MLCLLRTNTLCCLLHGDRRATQAIARKILTKCAPLTTLARCPDLVPRPSPTNPDAEQLARLRAGGGGCGLASYHGTAQYCTRGPLLRAPGRVA